mmetsp:Transcript_20826/g.67443  ORF Transcript_20826/g.67443 Transcript_20826/m.67443 type:complete len:237 (+) Transcript_20826:905-1615(+)
MMTGTSAEPIAVVMCTPSTHAMAVVTESAVRVVLSATPGASIIERQYPQTVNMARLHQFLSGSAKGFEAMRPWSLPNATMEPVKVTAPMRVPAQMAMMWVGSEEGWSTALATEVPAAAAPTSEWNAATNCGRSVMASDLAMPMPTVAPMASVPAICVQLEASVAGAMAPRVAATPSVTPITPSVLPRLAVFCEESPAIAPMQHKPEASPTIAWSAGVAMPMTIAPAYAATVAARPR